MTGQSYWFFSKWGREERQNFSRLLSTKVRYLNGMSPVLEYPKQTNKQTPRLQWWPPTPGLWVFWFGFESSWSPCSWDRDQKLSRSTYLVTLSLTHVRGVWGFICSSEGQEMEGTLGETLRTETWAFLPGTQSPRAGSQVPPSQGASGEDWGLGNWSPPSASWARGRAPHCLVAWGAWFGTSPGIRSVAGPCAPQAPALERSPPPSTVCQ